MCLHLVEKSLQRIVRGQKNAMYTTQKSIENKAGAAAGWRELLMSVGFRYAFNDITTIKEKINVFKTYSFSVHLKWHDRFISSKWIQN